MIAVTLCLVLCDHLELWQEAMRNLDEYLVSPQIEMVVLDLSGVQASALKLRENFPYCKWVQVPEKISEAKLWERYQYLFKGNVVVWMQYPSLLAPGHMDSILPLLKSEPQCVVLPELSGWPKLPLRPASHSYALSKLKSLKPLLCVFQKNQTQASQNYFWELFAHSGKVKVATPPALQIAKP